VVADVFPIFVVEVFICIIVHMHRLISGFISLYVSYGVFGSSSKVQISKKNIKKKMIK
jgi:hypothetical protein